MSTSGSQHNNMPKKCVNGFDDPQKRKDVNIEETTEILSFTNIACKAIKAFASIYFLSGIETRLFIYFMNLSPLQRRNSMQQKF